MDYNPLTEYIDYEDGEYVVKALPFETVVENYTKIYDEALTKYFDEKAQENKYDNRITCMVRAGFDGAFQQESIRFAQWVDACNVIAYQTLQDVINGTRQKPASVEEFINSLPAFEWN